MQKQENKKEKAGVLTTARKIFLIDETARDVPNIALQKARRTYTIAIAFVIVSIVFAILFRGIGMVLFGVAFGLMLLGYGYYEVFKIKKRGFYTIDVVCSGIKYTVTPSFRLSDGVKRRPREFIVKDPKDSQMYAIPTGINSGLFIKEDSRLRVYIVNGSEIYERQGLNRISEIIGFDVLS